MALLWVVKEIKQTSILFPVMLIVMVLVRKLIEKLFTEEELGHLDDKMPEIRWRKKKDKETTSTEQHPHVSMGSSSVIKIPFKNVMQLGTCLRKINPTTSATPAEAPPKDSKRQGS